MSNTLSGVEPVHFAQSVVATYRDHDDAETAVRALYAGGLPINHVSIIGRNFETHEEIKGFYRPADAALDGAGVGALLNALTAVGIPRDQALKYQERLQAGEFVVVVHGDTDELTRAREILGGTAQTHLETHTTTSHGSEVRPMEGMDM